jgi:flagellar motor switch protein FliM
MANDTFARQLSTVLSTTLRVVTHASVTSVRQLAYDDYIRGLPNPSLLSVLAFDTLPGSGVFQMPMDIVMSVIDRLLGGPGGVDQPSRALSDIETGLVRNLVQRIAGEMTYAFESILPVHAEVAALESNTQLLQLVPPSDPVVLSELEIRIGDQAAVSTLCLPLTTLQPVLAAVDLRPTAGGDGARSEAAQAVERRLRHVDVDVRVAFREVGLSSAEVFALAVGDIVPLRHPVAEPLVVVAEGVRVATARPGGPGLRTACQIVST